MKPITLNGLAGCPGRENLSSGEGESPALLMRSNFHCRGAAVQVGIYNFIDPQITIRIEGIENI
jgi:hypothetical protein